MIAPLIAVWLALAGLPTQPDPPVVVNRTGVRIAVVAVELETATRYDPARTLDLAPDDDRVLPPGSARRIRPDDVLGGYRPGDGLQLFVYRVDGVRAELAGTRSVTAEEIAADRRIALDARAVGETPLQSAPRLAGPDPRPLALGLRVRPSNAPVGLAARDAIRLASRRFPRHVVPVPATPVRHRAPPTPFSRGASHYAPHQRDGSP